MAEGSDRQRVVVVGCGGIGKALLPTLCRYLNYDPDHSWRVVLVDGDSYDDTNATRQAFARLGNKAEVTAEELAPQFTNLVIESVPAYLAGPDDSFSEQMEAVPVADLIKEGDIVFSCVDNHKTRLTISEHCQTLQNIKLISGGNDITSGNVQVYVRRAGRDLFAPIEQVHNEIASARREKAPHEMSCEELAVSGIPQVLVTNFLAAAIMLATFYAELHRQNNAGEMYFTVQKSGTCPGPGAMPFERKPLSKK